MNKPIRVLQITDCIKHGGGVSEVIMNYYRFIDAEEVLFDFMVNEPVDDDLRKWIESRGSKIYVMPALSIKNTFRYKNELEKFFKVHQDDYQIVHGHTPNAAAYYMPVAKKYGVPVRILHSHNSRGADSRIKRVRNRIMSHIAIKSVTQRFACSRVAAEYLYGDDNAFILNNAIDLDSFSFDVDKRKEIRDDLEISEDTILIGHIGRMAEQKNHKFIIEIAAALNKCDSRGNKDYKFLLVGDGPLRTSIETDIKEKNLENQFILTGVLNNAKEYYNAMDAFILPSLYEGLPVVGIEAQANGVPMAISENVTADTLIAENTKMLSIDDADVWKEWILENAGNREDNKARLSDKGFDIVVEANKLSSKYRELIEK